MRKSFYLTTTWFLTSLICLIVRQLYTFVIQCLTLYQCKKLTINTWDFLSEKDKLRPITSCNSPKIYCLLPSSYTSESKIKPMRFLLENQI